MTDSIPALPIEAECETKELFGGEQHTFKFPNGYGASVVRHSGSYGGRAGKFELAVLDFHASKEGKLTYDTPITDDVIGWLEPQDIAALLLRIKAL